MQLQRQLDVDIVISGHTHKVRVRVRVQACKRGDCLFSAQCQQSQPRDRRHPSSLIPHPSYTPPSSFHQFEAWKADGAFFINPGSATGAYSACDGDVTPSFVLMDVQGTKIVAYIYKLVNGEVKVDKLEYSKEA